MSKAVRICTSRPGWLKVAGMNKTKPAKRPIRMTVELPPELHAKIKARSDLERRSLRQQVVVQLERSLRVQLEPLPPT